MKTVLKICASGLKELQVVAVRSIWWRISPSDMALTVQKHLQGVGNSILEAHDSVRLFPISRNSPTQEKQAKNPRDRFHYFGRLSASPLD